MPARALLRMMAVVLMVAAMSACDTAADAGGSFGTGELLGDVASRITASDTLDYTATFMVPGNATVSITHEHATDRTAYRFPGGVIVLTPDATTACLTATARTGSPAPTGSPVRATPAAGTSMTCTASAPTAPNAPLAPAVALPLQDGGMIRPETVITLLTQMSLNNDAITAEADRTVAGTNATCVSITGVPVEDQFTACVSSDGLLASFHGTQGGNKIDMQLVQFQMSTGAGAFALPKTTT